MESILQLARQRGTSLPYAGAVTPHEAYLLLLNEPSIHLIDVRTNAERDWVGQVQVRAEQHHAVQWSLYPSRSNPDFLSELAQAVPKQATLLFLCRSAMRSKAAAQLATEQGYANCYDILEGFEGDKDAHGHRKTINGWCYLGLPWRGA